MKNDPFKVLSIDPGKYDEASLKKRYLELIQKYTPEKRPEKFEEIRTAYNTIKNARSPYEALSLAPIDMTGNITTLTKEELKELSRGKAWHKKSPS